MSEVLSVYNKIRRLHLLNISNTKITTLFCMTTKNTFMNTQK